MPRGPASTTVRRPRPTRSTPTRRCSSISTSTSRGSRASRIYHAKLARDRTRSEKGAEAVRARLRDNPNEVDIARGDALNVALDELSDPKIFANAVYVAGKKKVGGEAIRDIPFQYASAAISVSVHQLTQGGAPAVLKNNAAFDTDRTALRALAAELRKEGDETGTHKPETIQKAKDQILATKAKIEATLPKELRRPRGRGQVHQGPLWLRQDAGDPRRQRPAGRRGEAPRRLAGRPDAIHGQLQPPVRGRPDPRQKEVYRQLYPMLVQLRNEVVPTPGSTPDNQPSTVGHDAPIAAFDKMSFDQIDGKTPPPPAPQLPR